MFQQKNRSKEYIFKVCIQNNFMPGCIHLADLAEARGCPTQTVVIC